MRIPEKIKKELKRPLGKVFQIKELLKKIRGKKAVAVGDITGKKLKDFGREPEIWIYDGKEKRKRVGFSIPLPTHIARNPKGNITENLMKAIKDVLKIGKGRVFVKGEEDLAALYAAFKAQKSFVVLYGQPDKGIVMMDKKRAKELSKSLHFL